ncbi:protein tyrosine phosphatase [Gordoniibacillus kamchatkensis]|uniref:Protein tyrosine phosphatase n=1 Tax=Gordoniibacillus kamchatkensis TaxID=1590651 RepID=A0ABR5AAF8_9BACL|nr:low molecular weight protein arginine phosphatase [Paenibacillus sp. VKM B-2647]KIL37993.1 protein tyrosine phosphatase [Paenibacillus sp. VKM B-2647]
MKRILFVCTGNTCRSPMAEGLFRDMARKAGIDAEARSAGVAAFDGDRISQHSATILRARGLPADGTSSALTKEHVAWADLILTMSISHKRAVVQRHPEAVEKTYTLREYVERDEAAAAALEAQEQLVADMELKRALGQTIPADDYKKLRELQRQTPDYDIGDPFGGSLKTYQAAAAEIEASLRKLIDKLKSEH